MAYYKLKEKHRTPLDGTDFVKWRALQSSPSHPSMFYMKGTAGTKNLKKKYVPSLKLFVVVLYYKHNNSSDNYSLKINKML